MKYFKKILVALIGIGTATYAQKLPDGFVLQQIESLASPVNMSFAPDGRIFVLEQAGRVRIIKGGQLLPQSFVQLDSVFSQKEKGLLGLAFDPDFATNGFIYFYYTCNLQGNRIDGQLLPGSGADAPVRNKVVRYTAIGDKALAVSKKTILDLDIIPGFLTNYNHDGGTMHFGLDKKLYIATGENTLWCPCYKEIFNNNCFGPKNCTLPFPAKPSQDLTVFHGKILRINADGTPPTDNPYYYSTITEDEHKKYIYAMGVRNPFSWHFRKGTNDIYFNDVGSGDDGNAREEVNAIIYTTSGRNFGYPNAEGSVSNSNYVDPIYSYVHRIKNGSNFYTPGSTFAGCAITGGVFYSPENTNWPSEYQNKYFFLDFCDGWINYADVDNGFTRTNFASGIGGNLTSSSSGGWGSIVLEVANDGSMYFLTRSQSSGVSGLYRITYQPTTLSGLNITPSIASNSEINYNQNTFVGFSIDATPLEATNQNVLWSVKPNNNGTFSNNNIFTPLSNGVVTVLGRSEANPALKYSFIYTVSGIIAPTGITISGSNSGVLDIVFPLDSVALQSEVMPSNITNSSVKYALLSGNGQKIMSNGVLKSNGIDGIVSVVGYTEANPEILSYAVYNFINQAGKVLELEINIINSTVAGTIEIGQTITFTSNVIPAQAIDKRVRWTIDPISGNGEIDENGVFTSTEVGEVGIIATSLSDTTITKTYNLNVTQIISTKDKIAESILVYPNPNTGEFTLKIPSSLGDVNIMVVNEAGQILYNKFIPNFKGEKHLNLKGIGKGMFRLSVVGKKGSYSEMILIE